MFQRCCCKSSQTSFLRGVMPRRGHGRDTWGWERPASSPRHGLYGCIHSVQTHQAGHSRLCIVHTYVTHKCPTENSSHGTFTKEEWSKTKEFPQQVGWNETIRDPWRQRNGEGSHTQDRWPTGIIPCSLLRKNPHPSQTEGILRAYLTTHWSWLTKKMETERETE